MSSELTWSISASGRPTLLALADGEKTITRVSDRRGSGAAEDLEELCREFGCAPRDVRRVRVDVGPGSFTGLRVAIVTARTIAEFAHATIESFTSFERLAVAALREGRIGAGDTVHFAFDARRDHVHEGLVRLGADGTASLVRSPRAIATSEFGFESDTYVAIDESLREGLSTRLEGLQEIPFPQADAEVLVDARLHSVERESNEVAPLYLMGTYADD